MPTRSRPRREKEEVAGTVDLPPLAEEVKTFDRHLSGWVDREGQFVLIKDQVVLGFFPRHEEALEAGYGQFGCGPFLVKQILMHEPVYQLGQVEP